MSSVLVAAGLLGAALPAHAVPSFSKVFNPDTIGPGSTAMLTFTIDNVEGSPVTDLAFTDILPASVTIASPGFISNTCDGTVSAPSGGTTITFSDGLLGLGQKCTIVVNVTSGTPGIHMNVSGDLTSSAGNSGSASADLTVDTGRPGFSKLFSPSTVSFGERSTLTFLIDNSANGSAIPTMFFTDNLPAGMLIADPANASTDCESAPTITADLTAEPGTSVIDFLYVGTAGFPAVAAGSTCTVVVDVVGGSVGSLGNVTGDLEAGAFLGTEVAGKAAAVLEVTGFPGLLALTKQFTDDPVAPGGTATLEFKVTNKSRDDSATGITFTDDLEATLTGLTPTLPPDPDPPCGAGSSLSFSLGVLTLTGGNLPSEGSCTFSVSLSVPAGATPGTYTNTTSAVSGDVGGEPETGNVAGDTLFVVAFPVLTKEFTDDPVGSGGVVTLEFTIANSSTSLPVSSVAFTDTFNEILPTSPSGAPAAGFCNGTGTAFFAPLVSNTPAQLTITDVTLAAGASCTFSMTLDIAAGAAAGLHPNKTSKITGKLDGTTPVSGPAASDSLEVLAAPRLAKEFTDDPVAPGGTVTLEFTLENLDDTNGASAIAFTDDLDAALAGLLVDSVDVDTCGGTPSGVASGVFGYSGGTLAAEGTCTIELTLTVPGGPSSGIHTNTTSDVSATVAGIPAASPAASDDLVVTGLLFSKTFAEDPVIAGGTATLTFTLDNTTGTEDATSIIFTDDLDAALPGLSATLPPDPDPPCGPGSVLTGVSAGKFLFLTDGEVPAGTTCSFTVDVTVPLEISPGVPTPDDIYQNVTSDLAATIGGSSVTLPPAIDDLEVNSTLLALTKEFTNDPVAPGGSVDLKFTLTNLSATEAVTDIAFADDLGTPFGALPGLMATAPGVNTCGGMATSGFPTDFFSYSGGSLAANDGLPGGPDTCTIRLSLTVPAAPLAKEPPFINTTTFVTGTVGTLDVFGDPASDELKVPPAVLSKNFSDDPVPPGSTATLDFTIENFSATEPLSGLSFSDNLSAVLPGLVATGLPQSGICGPGSMLGGSPSFLAFSGGNLPPGGICSFGVTVSLPAPGPGPTDGCGSFVNTTSALTKDGLAVGDPATDLLDVPATGPFVQVDGEVTFQAEDYSSIVQTARRWKTLSGLDPMVVSNGGAIKAGGGPLTIPKFAPFVTYLVDLEEAPQYFWFRYRAWNRLTNSFHFRLDDGPKKVVNLLVPVPNVPEPPWVWGRLDTPIAVDNSSGNTHTVRIGRRERRMELDMYVFTTDPDFDPSTLNGGLGPEDSARACVE